MTSSYPELYTKNVRVWIKHSTEVWQCAVVQKDFDKATAKLHVLTDVDHEEICIEVKENAALPPLRNPDILIGANDLTSLSYLHEPSVLYNLRVRFLQHNSIYTWCGIVLVAVNPFTDLEIYGEETIQTYHSNSALAQLDPHIYAVAEDAFTKLERNDLNQSVIVSGESGAGKTVSAKFAMRYFASIAGSDTSIEARVLASNPIMEAIGNAKTVRNDNSSRFGKYIQILFDRKSQAIMGGNMRTYLLEKSRVTYQSDGERNFHIFYQLRSWAKKNALDNLALNVDNDDGDGDSFAYLGSNERTAYDDMSRFVEALDTLGFSERQKNVINIVIAAILHGGNVHFAAIDDERCSINDDDRSRKAFAKFCDLLAVNCAHFEHWIVNRVLRGGREAIVKPNTRQEARDSLEATLKYLYERLFLWIVKVINAALCPPTAVTTTGSSPDCRFIGVLDIYGFEHFESNSFEQFCINYANEVLQQQFNRHVFKLEQEEYIREGIDWQFVTFTDNQAVIDLIETKPIGVLSLLDEESRFPKGTDESWCAKLYAQITGRGDVFRKPKFGYQKAFIIQHFADVVTYSVAGFLEKNKDTISDEQVELLKRSDVLEGLFHDDLPASGEAKKTGAGGKAKIIYHQSSADHHHHHHQQQHAAKAKSKATVGSQFRDSLDALMAILNSTEPHYVRCIKPNDNKGAFEFNNVRAVQQLRACGVLETIRISSNGFPSRWSYQDFANRYRVLRVGYAETLNKLRAAHETAAASSPPNPNAPKPTPRKLVRAASNASIEIRQICEDIVKIVYEEKVYSHFNLTRDGDVPQQQQPQSEIEAELSKRRQLYQFGKTKIFFRPGQVALLERIRAQKLRECAILMQRIIRGWLMRRRYTRIRRSIILLQRQSRGYLARKRYVFMRETRAATVIQTAWRAHHQRVVYAQIRRSVSAIQAYGRAWLARRRYDALRRERAAIVIQRYWRGYAARRDYRDTLRKIVLAQSCIRRRLARSQLKRLRIEARSVEHVTNLNRGLEKKIIELQQRINELSDAARLLKQTGARYDTLRADFDTLEAEIGKSRARERDAAADAAEQKAALDKALAANRELSAKIESLQRKNAEFADRLKANTDAMRHAADDSRALDEAVRTREQELRAEFDRERRSLQNDLEREQAAKQQLLSRVMDLESSSSAAAAESAEIVDRDYENRAAATARMNAAAAAASIAGSSPTKTRELFARAISVSASASNEIEANGPTASSDQSEAKTPTSAAAAAAAASATGPVCALDFDKNLQQISLMMHCTELEQELDKMKNDNQKLRRQMAKTIDSAQKQSAGKSANQDGDHDSAKTVGASAVLLAEQFAEVQDELERYKKERADLKKVILIEDWIRTGGGTADEKYQHDLLSTYKSLYNQLDEEISKKERFINKLRNENLYLKMSGNPKSMSSLSGAGTGVGGAGGALSAIGGANPSGQFFSLDTSSLETMDIDISICYQGMFKFKQEDIDFILRFLIYDVGPQNTFKCEAQTVAHIIFMCIRYIDSVNNESMIQKFMEELIAMTRKKAQVGIQKHGTESIVHVLSIAYKIAILIKYYSEYDIDAKEQEMIAANKSNNNNRNGDSGFSATSTGDTRGDSESVNSNHSFNGGGGANRGKQDDEDFDFAQALRNFDLTNFSSIFYDLIIWIYLKLIKTFQTRINNLIVPALLEHEELASSGMNVQKSINRSDSISSERDSPSPTEKEIHTLIKELSNMETMFRMHKLDEGIVFQFFKQIYYFIGTICLNNQLMRKDLCNNDKSIQIIYNLSYLEQFLREHNIPNWEEVKSMLDPITQANKLLITNKTDKQIAAIVQTTQALTVPQIFKIINMYTASDEERIAPSFFNHLVDALQKDRKEDPNDKNAKTLIMNMQAVFPLKIAYLQTEEETSNQNAAAAITGLKVNLKEIEIPLLLKGLERYMEKI